MDICPKELVDFAEQLADAAGSITRAHFRSTAEAQTKNDQTPVSIADQMAELEIRNLIEARYPDHGICGEEYGASRTNEEYVWVIDPIDGTKSFLSGKPIFGTLIGLLHEGRAVAGVIDMPALHERWGGSLGRKTTFQGMTVKTRSCISISDVWMTATAPDMFQGAELCRFNQLKNPVKYMLWGSDCMAYGLLASGFMDIVCEASMSPYDYIALVPVIEGAGGIITDWQGNMLNLDSDGTVLACGNENLHGSALELLSF